MPAANILFVSHPQQQCGVYQFGRNVATALEQSKAYRFTYRECASPEELLAAVTDLKPAGIVYNHYPSTMPWLNRQATRSIKVPQLGILHEVTQAVADRANNAVFDYHIAPDPTLLLNNPIVFKTGRLIPEYENRHPVPAVPTIGCFGFGTVGKGFDQVAARVQQEYDRAIIRLHMPFATFGDAEGREVMAVAQRCRELLTKPELELQVSHDFLTPTQLLDLLAANTVNAFFYSQTQDRGISSVIDHALAVDRPIAITRVNMFRHVLSAVPSICIEDAGLREIVAHGTKPLRPFQQEWTAANLVWDYERIVAHALSQPVPPPPVKGWRDTLPGRALRKIKRLIVSSKSAVVPPTATTAGDKQMWAKVAPAAEDAPVQAASYAPLEMLPGPLNRILDDAARAQYAPAIEALFRLVPKLMERKIARANIQQGFVLDTVLKCAAAYQSPKILCVGGYEDSAAGALKATGLSFEDIDPSVNYDLSTFLTKPSTVPASYDVIFSTSVIEHVKDDTLFVREIASLLAPGGVAILTCDYNDQYRPGDKIPVEDHRFYTQRDLRERLLAPLTDCALVDTPQWDCPSPDFSYGDCQYTFASLVFRKKSS